MELQRRKSVFAELIDAFPAVLGASFWRRVRQTAVFICGLLAFRSVIADCCCVPSGSMIPTLKVGDFVFVNKLAYDLKAPFTTIDLLRWSSPRRGDVVVFVSPATSLKLVKRVVGVPGDLVELRDNVLFLNGGAAQYRDVDTPSARSRGRTRMLLEVAAGASVASHPIMETLDVGARRTFAPLVVPAGKYFVMGDNRDQSLDSRYFGFVDRSAIIGRAGNVLLSPSAW